MNNNVLTKEMILQKAKVDTLSKVLNLNFWGSELDDINIINELINVETITLSTNRIITLAPFSKCLELRELFLRKER